MFHLFYILIISALGIWVGVLVKKINNIKRELESVKKEKAEIEEIGRGLAGWNQARQAKIDDSKNRIMSLLQGNGKITNDEAQKEFGVSDATAARYLGELEKEGKIVQQGSQKSIFYSLK